MKRTYFLQILFILTSFIAFKAQSQELDYAKSRDYWMVDENQNPVISKVFNLPPNATKSDIYEVVMDLVSKNYAASNFKILYADSTKGKFIVNANYQLIFSTMSVWHTIAVESRSDKVKVSFTLNSFEKPYYFRPDYFSKTEFLPIATEYPINQDKFKKRSQEQAFLAAVLKSLDLLGNFERTLTKVVNDKSMSW